MALKDRLRKAVSRESNDRSTTSSSSSPTSSGFTTPNLSPTPSDTNLPELVHSATSKSGKSLQLTKTISSGFSLSRFRSNKDDYAKFAPKKFVFRPACPQRVAMLNAWDWKHGNTRASFSSAFSGVSPCASRQNSVDIAKDVKKTS